MGTSVLQQCFLLPFLLGLIAVTDAAAGDEYQIGIGAALQSLMSCLQH
jgi:hypothetical protein